MGDAAASSACAEPRRIRVLTCAPLAGPLDYVIPAGAPLPPLGAAVEVPLGGRLVLGAVWDPPDSARASQDGEEGGGKPPPPLARLKPLARIFDAPPLPTPLRRFIDWSAAYTLTPPGGMLRMALSVPAALDPPTAKAIFAPAPALPAGLRMTAARGKILAEAALRPAGPEALARAADVSSAVARGLIQAGALIPLAIDPADAARTANAANAALPGPGVPDWTRPGPTLSPDQAAATAVLRDRIAAGGFSCVLLDGVTGAGKTEVYFEAVAAALAAGGRALALMPEIALTAQQVARFRDRFGVVPDLWHSHLGAAERRRTWRRCAEGRARVVLGARSALYLPLSDLKLILVDEEHDAGFKQEDGALYHARDMAVARARCEGALALLASATPSLETWINAGAGAAEGGRYARLILPARHGAATPPAVEIVDLRRQPPSRGRWLSPALVEAVGETLGRGEQAMLFLNRRGYAPLTLCRSCGHRLKCASCDAWLVEHRAAGKLRCHHCGWSEPTPAACPACGTRDSLAACGPGVERVLEEAVALWPDARVAVASSDHAAGEDALRLAARMRDHEIDLLVGTQMMAKGHHFPDLTLVGVVDADLGLAGGDLRAAERSFQTLTQAVGRAGRGDRPGRALMQTTDPDNAVIRAIAAGDRDGFLAAEAEARAALGMPPFGRLAAIILAAEDEATVERAAELFRRAAPRDAAAQVLGPAAPPLALLRGWRRRRFLLKTPREVAVQPILRAWLARVKVPAGVRVSVDVDPVSFL